MLLKAGNETADKAIIEICMPGGKVINYDIPLIKISDYTIEEIFREKMFMLIPFYIFNYESRLEDINNSEEQLNQLLDDYEELFTRLEKEQDSGNLSAVSYDAIIRLTYSVAYKLTMKQDNVQRKVGDVMGGKVLDLPCFKAYDQGLEQGLEQGREQGIEQGIEAFIEDKIEDGISVDVIKSKLCKRFVISEEKSDEYIAKYINQ